VPKSEEERHDQEVWSVDEMMVNVKNAEPMGKGYYSWMWSIINPQTRFVVATEISKRRETRDAKKIFETGKQRVERWHNEVRELTKTKRGLGNNKSAQVYMDLARINHNYCKSQYCLTKLHLQLLPVLI
jgi:transposase-like protein